MVDAQQSDELLFLEEDDGGEEATLPAWRILIVDDDVDVHAATKLALKGTAILGRPLSFLHAYSAAEAVAVLQREADIAVILLDVVMENESAGLKLVHTIRQDLRLSDTRIVLRTGQPGYAPEIQAIRDYDINDYKTKSELNHTRLYTTLTVAIRSYDQIRAINASRRGLDMIVRASGELMELRGLQAFAAGVIAQLAALLRLPPEGLICVRDQGAGPSDPRVIAAGGRYTELINRPIDAVPEPAVRAALVQALESGETRFDSHSTTLAIAGEGRRIAVHLDTRHPIEEIDRHLLEVFCTNIAVGFQNVALISQLLDYAYVDSLTHLPNRLRFKQELDTRTRGGRRADHAVALVDIDGFAETNDALGHVFGDRLLCAVAERLRSALPGTFIARVAGDTFGVLGDAGFISESSFTGIFNRSFVVGGQEVTITTTKGFLLLGEIDGGGEEALKSVSIALQRAKMRHRGDHVWFSRELDTEVRERHRLLQDLRGAFAEERLFLMYQPQVDLATGEAVGAEALIRWKREDGAFVPPDRFIPIAEHFLLIINIGTWVLRTACHEQARLARAGHPGLRIAINVSLAQFRHPDFIATVTGALADSGAQPRDIELEITESMAMDDTAFVIDRLNQLSALGIKVAIDDFGTGFSSLAYLQNLRVDRLKIDRAFVHDLCGTERGQQIPETVIQLGRRLGLTVIAEGVESGEQAAALRRLGCHEAQGYYFARPMDPRMLEDWLSAKRTNAAP